MLRGQGAALFDYYVWLSTRRDADSRADDGLAEEARGISRLDRLSDEDVEAPTTMAKQIRIKVLYAPTSRRACWRLMPSAMY